MSTHAENQERIRLAILGAIRKHVPAWNDAHVHWLPGVASFGAPTGVIELQPVSSVEEAHREVTTAGETITKMVFREVTDVRIRLAGLDCKDVASRLLSNCRRQDFVNALAPIARLRLPTQLTPHKELRDGRSEDVWSFELVTRAEVSYSTVLETKERIESLTVSVTAEPEFSEVPIEVETP